MTNTRENKMNPEGHFYSPDGWSIGPRKPDVKVKPLVWRDQHNGSVGAAPDGGIYMLFNDYSNQKVYCATGQLAEDSYPNLESAKAAAQADFERRIRSALE